MPLILGRCMSQAKGDRAPSRRRKGRQGNTIDVDDEDIKSNHTYLSTGWRGNQTLDASLPNPNCNDWEEPPKYTVMSSSSHIRSNTPADFITISVATTAEMSGTSLSSSLSIGSIASIHGGRGNDDNDYDWRSPAGDDVRGLSPSFYVGSPPSHLPPVGSDAHFGSPPGSLSSRHLRTNYEDRTAGCRQLSRSPPRPLSPPVTLHEEREEYQDVPLSSVPPTCATPSPTPRVGSCPLHLQVESHRAGSPPLRLLSFSRSPPKVAEVADFSDSALPRREMRSSFAHPCLLPLVEMEEDEATETREANVDKPPLSLLRTMISTVDEEASELTWGYFVDTVDDGNTAYPCAI